MTEVSELLRPDIFRDGNQWCALHGPDLQAGVAGFGDTPEEAVRDFYAEWAKGCGRQPTGDA